MKNSKYLHCQTYTFACLATFLTGLDLHQCRSNTSKGQSKRSHVLCTALPPIRCRSIVTVVNASAFTAPLHSADITGELVSFCFVKELLVHVNRIQVYTLSGTDDGKHGPELLGSLVTHKNLQCGLVRGTHQVYG